jgi:hypothetical protein
MTKLSEKEFVMLMKDGGKNGMIFERTHKRCADRQKSFYT